MNSETERPTARPHERIRPARGTDLEAVASLCAELGYPLELTELSSRLSALAQEPRHALLVADRPGEGVIGLVHVYTDTWLVMASTAEIGGLVVREGLRGDGVGAHLLAAAERWASERGCSRLFVRTNAIRQRAHRFYERQGYGLLKSQRVYQRTL